MVLILVPQVAFASSSGGQYTISGNKGMITKIDLAGGRPLLLFPTRYAVIPLLLLQRANNQRSANTMCQRYSNLCCPENLCLFCGGAFSPHNLTGPWQKDDTGHWHICQNEGCSATDTKIAHSGIDDGYLHGISCLRGLRRA